MPILIFFIAHWYLSLFFQTFFHHRYAAHKQFHMSNAWEKTFFILSFIFQGSSYLSPYAYGVMHRMHHAFADTKDDPHSPKHDKNLVRMMLKAATKFNDVFYERKSFDEKFTKGVPKWTSFDRFANRMSIRVAWGVVYCLFYLFFATHWWMYFLIPIHFFMGPVHGAVINWFAHKIGYTNFEVDNTSKNLLPFDFLMLGESYHNNHHKYMGRSNFGFKWFEIDPVYIVIRIFDKLNIIQLRKV